MAPLLTSKDFRWLRFSGAEKLPLLPESRVSEYSPVSVEREDSIAE
jgi:hypothetical protein